MKKNTNGRTVRDNGTTGSMHRRLRLGILLVLSCIVSSQASAEWQVVDREVRSNTRETVRELDKANASLISIKSIGAAQSVEASSVPGESTEAEKLDVNNIGKVSNSALDESKRCPQPPSLDGAAGGAPVIGGSGGGGVLQQQHQLCQEIVRTERAMYTYSLELYKQAKKRHEKLIEIQNRRAGMSGTDDFGKLQSNTNELLQLIALMDIDQQRGDTYMNAYDARIAYLSQSRDHLSRQALEGDPQSKSKLANLASGVALKVLLSAQQSQRR